MAPGACSLEPPAFNGAAPPSFATHSPTQAATPTWVNHTNAWLWSPTSVNSAEAQHAAFRANQYREVCNKRTRYLLVENDLRTGVGLGMLSKLLVAALRLALRDDRVMLEIPRRNRTGTIQHLWCDRSPHTLEGCAFAPWSRCRAAADKSAVRPRLQRRPDRFEWPLAARVVRLPLSYVYFWGGLWGGRTSWMDVRLQRLLLARLLLRPRRWTRAIGDCVLHAFDPEPPPNSDEHPPGSSPLGGSSPPGSRFVALFVRDSPEKSKELGGQPLPALRVYARLAQALGRSLSAPRLLLQTSSPAALAYFRSFAANSSMPLAYTEHARSEHDGWGRSEQPARAMEHAAIAAANLHAASKAVAFISLAHSMWLQIQLGHLSVGDGEAAPIRPLSWIQVRCRTSPMDIRIAMTHEQSAHDHVQKGGSGVDHLRAVVAQETELGCRVMGFKEETSELA